MRRTRRLVLSAAALGLAAAATGCAYINPVQTHEFYQSGDGTIANLEDSGAVVAGVRNAIVVVQDDGTAELLGAVVNYSGEDLVVELEGTSDDAVVFSTRVATPAGQTVDLGSGEDQQLVSIEGADVQAGGLIDLSVSADGISTEITVPVTDTTLTHYGADAEAPAQG